MTERHMQRAACSSRGPDVHPFRGIHRWQWN